MLCFQGKESCFWGAFGTVFLCEFLYGWIIKNLMGDPLACRFPVNVSQGLYRAPGLARIRMAGSTEVLYKDLLTPLPPLDPVILHWSGLLAVFFFTGRTHRESFPVCFTRK